VTWSGSTEWLTVNFGKEGVDYTMKDGNPQLTERGSKEVATTYQFLVTPLSPVSVTSGFSALIRAASATVSAGVRRGFPEVRVAPAPCERQYWVVLPPWR